MKKQKMLAVLLCLMLVVTTIPMLALAAGDTTPYDTMGAVLTKYGVNTNYTSYAYWSMTEKIPNGAAGFQNAPYGATIDPDKGTYINGSGSNATFRYNNGDPLWSSLETKKRFVYFKAQVSETDKLEVLIQDPTGVNKRGSFIISATEFRENLFGGSWDTNENFYTGAGTKMNEYLIINDSDTMAKLFVKGEITEGKWRLAVNAYTFQDLNTTGNGLHFSGTGWVKDVTLYGPAVTYEDIDTIAGEKLYNMPNYEKTTPTTTATNGRYTAPFGPSISEGMVPVFRAKLDSAESSMRIVLRKPGETTANYSSYEFTVTPDLVKTESASFFVNDTFKFTNDVDYALFATKTECKLYAKSDNQLGGKWIHLLTDTTASSKDNSYNATPVIWADAGSFTVDNLKIYQPVESYASPNDAAGGPVIAEQSFTDFMRYSPVTNYSPLKDRVFTFRAKACPDGVAMSVYVHDYKTEQNTYAFQITKDGLKAQSSDKQSVVLNEGFVPGTDAHDYLVIENKAKNGILVYVKDAEDKWAPVFGVNGYTPDVSKTFGLYIFNASAGKGELESATVYTKDSLVLADGSGNAVYNDGTLTTPAALRIKNNGATGKLLVVSYKGNDMAKAQLVDAASVTAEGQVFDTTADGVTKVKVFHWDSFTGLNRVTPAVTLNYAQ